MVSMLRNKRPFWIRHCVASNEMREYSDATQIFINLFPTNADSDLIALGKQYIEYMRAKISLSEAASYNIGDLIYTEKPVFEDKLDVGNAMYEVTAILPVLNVCEIMCHRLSDAV